MNNIPISQAIVHLDRDVSVRGLIVTRSRDFKLQSFQVEDRTGAIHCWSNKEYDFVIGEEVEVCGHVVVCKEYPTVLELQVHKVKRR